jgi:hypothetical protein
MKHITEEQVIHLADGELRENEAASLRDHARGCGACRERIAAHDRLVGALAAPVRRLRDASEIVELAMERIAIEEATRPARSIPPARRRILGVSFVVAVGVAVAAANVALFLRPQHEETYVAARGGDAAPSLSRDVGVTIVRVEGSSTRPLASSGSAADAYAIVTRNLHDRVAHALVFAVDAADAVHWVAPIYFDASSDPASAIVERSSSDVLRGPAVALDRPAPGPLRFLAILSERPMHVSEIERLAPPQLALSRLRARFPSADVRDLGSVRIDAHTETETDR